jgi:hypothetical protein
MDWDPDAVSGASSEGSMSSESLPPSPSYPAPPSPQPTMESSSIESSIVCQKQQQQCSSTTAAPKLKPFKIPKKVVAPIVPVAANASSNSAKVSKLVSNLLSKPALKPTSKPVITKKRPQQQIPNSRQLQHKQLPTQQQQQVNHHSAKLIMVGTSGNNGGNSAVQPPPSNMPPQQQLQQSQQHHQQQQQPHQLNFFPSLPIPRNLPAIQPRPLPLLQLPLRPPQPSQAQPEQPCIPLHPAKVPDFTFFIFHPTKACGELADWGHGQCRHHPIKCSDLLATPLPYKAAPFKDVGLTSFFQVALFEWAIRHELLLTTVDFNRILNDELKDVLHQFFIDHLQTKAPAKIWGAAHLKRIITVWHNHCVAFQHYLSVQPVGGVRIKRDWLDQIEQQSFKLWIQATYDHFDDVINHSRYQMYAEWTRLVWREKHCIIGDLKAGQVAEHFIRSKIYLRDDVSPSNPLTLRDIVFIGSRVENLFLCFEATPLLAGYVITLLKEARFTLAKVHVILFAPTKTGFSIWVDVTETQNKLIPAIKPLGGSLSVVYKTSSVKNILKTLGF